MKRNILALAGAFALGCFITVHSASAQSLTFAPTTYTSDVNIGDLDPNCLVAADINGDGRPDLICVNNGSSTLTVVTNNSNRGFGSNAPVNVGSAVVWAVAADVNGDNKQDLICANGGNPGKLTVMTNNGDGIFSFNATLAVGAGPMCIAAADINGDHKIDLISANTFGDTLTVYTNNGSGGFGFNATLNAKLRTFCPT
jgi:hypothetical protein